MSIKQLHEKTAYFFPTTDQSLLFAIAKTDCQIGSLHPCVDPSKSDKCAQLNPPVMSVLLLAACSLLSVK